MCPVKQSPKKMKRNRLLLLNLIVLLNISGVYGQNRFTLAEFINIGLENNYSLQITRNRQEISDNNYTPGNAGFFPVVDLSTRHSGNINNSRQTFEDGGSASSGNVLNTTTNAGVNLGWNIFSGFRVRTSYMRLEELKMQGELSTRLAIESFIAQTASEYYNYIQQAGQLNNLLYAVTLSRERYRIDEERYTIGSGSRMQMLQSRVFLNADSSRLSRQYEVLRASQVRLNELMGTDDFESLYGPVDTLITVDGGLVYEDLLASTVQDNTDLLLTESDRVISEYDRQIIKSRTYPYVSFASGYGYTFNTYQAGNLSHQRTLGMNYSVTVGINLFDGFNRRREISNSALLIENSQLSYLQLLQQIKADLLTIYKDYENNLRLLQMEHENLETARENMDIAFERYRLGELAGIELREVQQSLLEAEERLLLIQYQTKLAEISLLQISGRIMEYLG